MSSALTSSAAGQPGPLGWMGRSSRRFHVEREIIGIAHVLEHAGGYSPEEARRLAEPMLPDILPYDPTRPVGYPDNGRLFTDDVGDHLVAILTNGRVTEDKVGPHDDFLSEFPYLGPPHKA